MGPNNDAAQVPDGPSIGRSIRLYAKGLKLHHALFGDAMLIREQRGDGYVMGQRHRLERFQVLDQGLFLIIL